ncbi:hypothetical protein [Deinococcus hopiensis]|uniref:Ig-like domain (Group 3) n=1 Tax=Deinococcus hopiensis KR-140 TaxID=695939 RepID=A0A1W1VBW1_9DEIO|nr:hypothetical protein [Deinococcus hopiensis]SMB90464.1 hypothetical protein SAMN00790413_00786 [Deinococcus hopiensis KR-140]
MNRNLALLALTGVLTLAACSGGGSTPAADACATANTCSVTVNLSGVSSAQFDVTVNGTTTRQTLTNGQKLPVSNTGTVTLSPVAQTGFTTPSAQSTTISSTNLTPTLSFAYTAVVTNPNPNPGNTGATIAITSPANGDAPAAGNTLVKFNTTGALTNITCSVNGGAAVNATVGSTGGFCVLPLTAGPATITVSGTDSNGKTVSSNVVVTVPATGGSTVNITPGFNPGQQITAVNNGSVNYADPAFANGAWRIIPQQIDATGITPVYYVRGTVGIDVGPSTATRVELFVSNTSNGPARFYLYDGAPKANAVQFDSNVLNGDQGLVRYLVTRTYLAGQPVQTSSFPFIVDNTAPQPADPELDSAGGTNDRFIADLRGVKDLNFARGTVINYLSNTDLRDREGPLPSGIDRVTYYYVPATNNSKIPALPNSLNRVAAIKANATKTRVAEDAGANGKYQVSYDSVAEKEAEGATYYIYAVITDQLGNEVDSTYFQKISFDNVAPRVGAGLRDTSALPFASCDPQQYISDWFAFSQTASDGGVGFVAASEGSSVNNSVSLDAIAVPLTGVVGLNGIVSTINGVGGEYDSNLIADGRYQVNARVADLLGNTVDPKDLQQVTIDNTDPAVNFVSPAPGELVASGTQVRANTQLTETGAGIDPSRTVLMWNDFTDPSRTRTNGYVGGPVEFAKGNNALWRALAPNDTTGNVHLQQLAVDCAGNASIGTRTVQVKPTAQVNSAHLPTFGKWDVYQYEATPNYTQPVQAILHRFNGDDNFIDLTGSAQGLFTADVALPNTTTRAGSGSQIDEVNFYRKISNTSWDQIVAYLTGQFPDGTTNATINYAAMTLDPSIRRQGQRLANERQLQWVGITDETFLQSGADTATPLLNIVPTQTSSNFYRMTANYKNLEHGVSGIYSIVTDTFGMYSYTADFESSYSVRNTTAASTLAATFAAGDVVNLDFAFGSKQDLIAKAAGAGYHLQGSVDGVNFVDLDALTTWTPANVAAGTSTLRVSYSVPAAPKYRTFRVRLSSGVDVFYSDAFTLNIQ